jgi:hypothetical protein
VLIGKSINFVRECCNGGGTERGDESGDGSGGKGSGGGGGDSVEGLQAHAATAHAHAAAFTYDASVSPTAKGVGLAHVIAELSVVMNERLVRILLHEYKLLDHCEAMKKVRCALHTAHACACMCASASQRLGITQHTFALFMCASASQRLGITQHTFALFSTLAVPDARPG